MKKLSYEQVHAFRSYVDTAARSAEDLTFLLENFGLRVALDWSESSLHDLEHAYFELISRGGLPDNLGGGGIVEHLVGQYLGQSIVNSVGGKWTQCRDANRFFGEPCIDEFGNERWEKIFPVSIARSLSTIAKDQPQFPGAKSRTVLREAFRKALKSGTNRATR